MNHSRRPSATTPQFKDKRCALPLPRRRRTASTTTRRCFLRPASPSRRRPSTSWPPTRRSSRAQRRRLLEVVGFDPLWASTRTRPSHYGPMWGGDVDGREGKSALAEDPAWEAAPAGRRSSVDRYGYDKLVKWQAGAGDEFSASNAFETRQARDDARRRVPRSRSSRPSTRSSTSGPRRCPSATPKPAPRLGLRHRHHHRPPEGRRSTRTRPGAREVPLDGRPRAGPAVERLQERPVDASLPEVDGAQVRPKFATFLNDLREPEVEHAARPPIGASDQTLFSAFLEKWQAGTEVEDLHDGLADVDKQINARSSRPGKRRAVSSPAAGRALLRHRRRPAVDAPEGEAAGRLAAPRARPAPDEPLARRLHGLLRLSARVSFVLSFTHYDLLSPPRWVGLANYSSCSSRTSRSGPRSRTRSG